MIFQLQHLVGDEICVQAMEMFLQEKKKGGTGGPIASAHQRNAAEQTYQRKAEQLMSDENCFKVVLVSGVQVTGLLSCLERLTHRLCQWMCQCTR